MKRGWLAVLGSLVLVVGIALAVAGVFVATTVGSDDLVSTAPAHVHGTGVAVVAEDVRVEEDGFTVPSGLGSLTLSVRAPDGRAMFAGAAAPADVDHYLTGAPYDVVVDLSAGSTATTRAVPGTQQPAPPDSVQIWTASSSGAPASLAARSAVDGTLVVMNADARPGVDADVLVTLRVPHAWVSAWVAVGVGVVLVVLGVVLIWRARAARHREAEPALATEPIGTTVLPGPVLDTSPAPAETLVTPAPESHLSPASEALVTPASEALAALVVEAGGDPSGPALGTEPADAELEPVEPVESVESPPAADAAPRAVVGTPEPVAPSPSEPVTEPDATADPVFAELVSAYGVDPVHDALPTSPGGGGSAGGTDRVAPAPSGTAPSDG